MSSEDVQQLWEQQVKPKVTKNSKTKLTVMVSETESALNINKVFDECDISKIEDIKVGVGLKFDVTKLELNGTTQQSEIETFNEVPKCRVKEHPVGLRDAKKQVLHKNTDNKRTKAELQKSFSLLQAILESTACGIIVYNCQGRIIYFNEEFVDMWKIPDEIMALQDCNQQLAFCSNQLKDPKTFIKRFQELYSQPDIDSYDILELKDGRIFEKYSKPQRLGKQIVGRVWNIQDITERKRNEQELPKVLVDKLEKQNACLQRFATQSQELIGLPNPQITRVATSQSIFPTYPQLNEIFNFIEENYHKQIFLDDVAQVVGYSSSYLTQLVRRLTGKTVYNWIVERRMVEARSLLLKTNQTVDQIANTVGYKDASHFFKQFRQLHKTTPHVWRKLHQSQYAFTMQKVYSSMS